MHGGGAPQVRAAAAARAEVIAWGANPETDPRTGEPVRPGETLLRIVGVTARRAELYAALLSEQFAAEVAGEHQVMLPAGVGALIGHKYDLAQDGTRVAVEEAIRGLAQLEAQERDRCAKYAKAAIDAGVSERLVRLEESKGAMIIEVLRRMLDLAVAAGLTADQRRLVWAQAPAVLRGMDGGAA